ncbi:D-aminoacyl-tRNA deacylase [Caldicellulosiruptoraceae bacterium PP1]
MRAVVQRVSSAYVKVNNEIVGSINRGLCVLIGIGIDDDIEDARYLVDKIINLRIFEDEQGKFNLSLLDIKGEVLVISNFTVMGDARKGKRPNFMNAAPKDVATMLYENVIELFKSYNINVQTGIFQAHMDVNILNDGPVTIILDSKKAF